MNIFEMMAARSHMWQAQCRLGIKPAVTVVVNDFSFRMDDPISMTMPVTEPYLKITIPPDKLQRMLKRELHFNNLEVAGDVMFDRRPNTYMPDVHTLMSFFHI